MAHTCPVCGYPKLKDEPRTESTGGSFELCPSCGFQFGVTDDDAGFTYASWREKWRGEGMLWSSRSRRPKGWDPVAQLETVLRLRRRRRGM